MNGLVGGPLLVEAWGPAPVPPLNPALHVALSHYSRPTHVTSLHASRHSWPSHNFQLGLTVSPIPHAAPGTLRGAGVGILADTVLSLRRLGPYIFFELPSEALDA